MRNVTYYVACSVDGFIAHNDGTFDGFLQEGEHIAGLLEAFPETFPTPFRAAFGVDRENKHFDTVLMGRKTYEVGLNVGLTNPYPHLKQYLFSRSLKNSPDDNVELVAGDTVTFVQDLKHEVGKDIWLCGGGELASTLLAAKLLDKLILKINPFVMGSGIALFAGLASYASLQLTDNKIYDNGVVVLYYNVVY